MKKRSVLLIMCIVLNVVVLLIQAQDAEYTGTAVVERRAATLGIGVTSDGEHLIVGGGPLMNPPAAEGETPPPNSIVVYDLETGEMLQEFESTAIFVADVAITPDDSQIVAALSPSTVGILDIETGEVVRQYEGIASAVLDISPDGTMVISNARAAQPTLWDFETGEVIHKFDETTAIFGPVAFSPDSSVVAVVSAVSEDSNVLVLWDVETNSEIYRLDITTTPDIEFSPDGELIALAGAGLRIISVETGETEYELSTFELMDGTEGFETSSLAFSADGTQLVSAWNATSLVLWDLEEDTQAYIGGHDNLIWRAVFTPDGRVLTTSYDGRVMMWGSND